MTMTHMWCSHCGDAKRERSHTACEQALRLEPPQYCSICRRHLVPQPPPQTQTHPPTCPEHAPPRKPRHRAAD